jgi:hypothetical protein
LELKQAAVAPGDVVDVGDERPAQRVQVAQVEPVESESFVRRFVFPT